MKKEILVTACLISGYGYPMQEQMRRAHDVNAPVAYYYQQQRSNQTIVPSTLNADNSYSDLQSRVLTAEYQDHLQGNYGAKVSRIAVLCIVGLFLLPACILLITKTAGV